MAHIYANSCDGLQTFVVDPATSTIIEDQFQDWANDGAVVYLPGYPDGANCFIITESAVAPGPGAPYLIVLDPYIAGFTAYTAGNDPCEQCRLENPVLVWFGIWNSCFCQVVYCRKVLAPINSWADGYWSIPLLDAIVGVPQCWRIQANSSEADVCIEIPISDMDGAIFQPTIQQCKQHCNNAIIRNLKLVSCCNGFTIISKKIDGIYEEGIYEIPSLAATYPDAGFCWEASNTVEPYTIDLGIIFSLFYDQCIPCGDVIHTCIDKFPCPVPPPPICYTLIACPGQSSPDIIASNDLSGYVGSTVMVDGICYTVQEGDENCVGAVILEVFDSFTQCGEQTGLVEDNGCIYCECPPYYRREGEICIKDDCYSPVPTGTVYPLALIVPGPNSWGNDGVRFYGDVSTYVYPLLGIDIPPREFVEANGGGLPIPYITGNASNDLWHRMNQVALWPPGNLFDQWMGTVTCLTVTETKIYSFGFAADEGVIIKQDGVIIFTVPFGSGNIAWRFWHVFQLTLNPGTYIFEIFVYNSNGPGGVAFEIYNVDNTTLASQNHGTPINAGLIEYSTSIAATQGGTFTGTDNGYSCAPGYFISACEDNLFQCCRILELPYIHCEPSYLVENCVEDILTPPVITNTDLSLMVGVGSSRVCIPGTDPPDPYPNCDLCDPDYTWTPVSTATVWKGDCKSPEEADGRRHCYSPCNIFFVTPKGAIFYVNPFTYYNEQIANYAGVMNSGTNIANTADRLWILGGIGVANYIMEFSITLSPFQYVTGIPNPPTLAHIRDIPPSVPTLMYPACAFSNTILYGGFTSLVKYDIAGATVLFTTLFTLPNTGQIRDLMFLPASSSILILGTDTIGPFLSEYSLGGFNPQPLGTELNRATLSYSDFGGVMVDDTGQITVWREPAPLIVGNEVYVINQTNTGWQQGSRIAYANVAILGGMSKNPECTNLAGPPEIWPEGCYCVKVTELFPYDPAGIEWPYEASAEFDDCEICLKPCYTITTCSKDGVEPTVMIVDNDLSEYIGRVIKLPRLGDACWIVSSAECEGSVTVPGEVLGFDTCETCDPFVPPVVCMIGRPVKPGYDTPGCPPEYYERIACTFGSQAFDEMAQMRYGIKICCDHEMDKWDVRWQILQLKAIFDPTLCLTLTPSPSLTLSISSHCIGDEYYMDVHLVIVGGSGSYQIQKYVILGPSGTGWENLGPVQYGPTNGTVDLSILIATPEGGLTKIRVLDVICCTLGSNVVEGIFESCICIPDIDSSGSFVCTDPIDSSGTIFADSTFACGSGDYSFQFYNTDTSSWETINVFTGPTDGVGQSSYWIDRSGDETGTFRVIDNILETISNTFTIQITQCNGENELINIISPSFKCTTGNDGEITTTWTVVNGVGPYNFQIFVLGSWIIISNNIGSPFSFSVVGGTYAPGVYPIRVADTVTLVTSAPVSIMIVTCTTMRALYVNDFNTICGDMGGEDTLLAWAQCNNINTLYLYDLNTVIAGVADYPILDAFILKSLTYGITSVYGFRASETSNIGAVVRSNKSYNLAALATKLNFSFENEFWNYDTMTGVPPGNDANGNSAWPEWLVQQENIRTYAQSVALSNDFYIGIIRDDVYSTPTATLAAGLISYTDRIHISCYVSSAVMDTPDGAFLDILDRLTDLGTAGQLAGITVNVVVIFSAKLLDSYTYFQTHTFQQAYDKVAVSFTASSFTGKSRINLIGWNVYGYQQAKTLVCPIP